MPAADRARAGCRVAAGERDGAVDDSGHPPVDERVGADDIDIGVIDDRNIAPAQEGMRFFAVRGADARMARQGRRISAPLRGRREHSRMFAIAGLPGRPASASTVTFLREA